MANPATVKKMAADEFLEWEQGQPGKHEFIAGEIFSMVGSTRQHATVAGNVFAALLQHLRGKPCRAYMADMKLRLEAADAFFYPDLFVSCSPADHQAERYLCEPSLIIEVLSDSTEAYDRGDKFEKYRRFETLQEYVLIHPIKRRVETFWRDADNHWVLFEYNPGVPVHFRSVELTIASEAIYENV
jgi:Uma2 family endonuclease